MLKILKWVLISIGSLVVLAVIINVFEGKPANTNHTNNELKINGQSYELTDKEKTILRFFVLDEIKHYAVGGKTVLTPQYEGATPVIITADKLQRDYHSNEVAADSKYKNKHIIVTGSVASIDRGIGESYSISFNGGNNMFMQPRASIQSDHKNYLASLHKGDNITLYCKGDGMLIGSASLDDCISISSYTEKAADDYLNNLGRLLETNNKAAKYILFFSRAAAQQLSEDSRCYISPIDFKKCTKEINNLDTATFKKTFSSLGQKYGAIN